MSGFTIGKGQTQSTSFLERLEDYVSEENPVQVIDVFIDMLDLPGMEFKTAPDQTGRPAYHPSVLLSM